MQKFKPILFHLLHIVILYVATAVYFGPMMQGKKIPQGDIISSIAMNREMAEYRQETGEKSYWSNSMFGGMPHVTTYGKQMNLTGKVFTLPNKLMPRPAHIIFKAMLFGYLALVILGINPWLSLAGALAFGLTTNNIVITEAGHNAKMDCISTFPLILAGFLLVFRKKYLTGGVMLSLGSAMAIYARHPQMMYYLFLAMLVGGIAFFVQAIRDQKLLDFAKAAGVLLASAALALLSGITHISSLQNYSKDSMRGDPILTTEAQAVQTGSSSEVDGLAWTYAMQWSNGTLDLWSALIPGVVGGSSAEPIDRDAASARLFQSNQDMRAPLYWGDLPFTSGPPYFGAVIVLLFVVGLFLLPGHLRWWGIISVLLMLLLSMGDNFAALNRPIFDHFPLYNKFRSPNSILVVTSMVMVFFAMLGAQRLFELDPTARKEALKKLYYAVGGLGAVCLFFALVGPGFYDFRSEGDARYQNEIIRFFVEDRKALMQQDAWRTLIFVLLSGGLLWAYLSDRLQQTPVLLGLAVLTTLDFWVIDRRYINASSFVNDRQYEQNFQPRPVDQQILQMEPRGRGYYRVLDLSINTFNSSATSYYHNTIGGYSPVKLQRIQDVIDRHIQRNNQAVLDMLNTKYIINQEGQLRQNPNALGTAWFVSDIISVDSPNEEVDALNDFAPNQQAVVLTNEFSDYLQGFNPGNGEGTITLSEYTPKRLTYQTNTNQEQLAVFSEIWYGPNKGWTVTIDGEPADHIRANYLLRAMRVPPGQHTIQFTFDPATVYGTRNAIARASSGLILLLGIGLVGWNGYQWYQKPTPQHPEPTPKPNRKSKATTTRKKKKKGKK